MPARSRQVLISTSKMCLAPRRKHSPHGKIPDAINCKLAENRTNRRRSAVMVVRSHPDHDLEKLKVVYPKACDRS